MIVAVAAALVIYNVRGRGDAPWRYRDRMLPRTWRGGIVGSQLFDAENARWQHGWPLTYFERNCYGHPSGKLTGYRRRPQWSWLPDAGSMLPGEQVAFVSEAILLCNVLIALAVLVEHDEG